MRKLTGYIGAMIIVIALMGSILAGYALNINGTSTVMNEYEKVTDVSGLYTHTQEPSYIEYNPASNYIGYQDTPTEYTNNQIGPYNNHYRQLTDNAVYVDGSTPGIAIDGVGVGSPTGYFYAFICDYFYLYYEGGTNLSYYTYGASYSSLTVAEIIVNNTDVTVKLNNNAVVTTFNNVKLAICYCGNTDYDYLMVNWNDYGNQDIYVNNENQIIRSTTTPHLGVAVGNSWYYFADGTTYTKQLVQGNGAADYGVYKVEIRNDGLYTWGIFYPRSVLSDSNIGINYTESNRVNNYPVPGNNETPTTTQNQTINISNLNGITNYYPVNQYDYHIIMYKNDNVGMSNVGVKYSNIGLEMPYKPVTGDQYEMVNYKLSDILTNGATIPANTKSIKIELNSNNQVAYNRNLNQTNVISYCDLNIPCLNNGTFENTTVPVSHFRNYTMETNNGFGTKDYAIYNIQDNTVTIYSYDGVKKSVLAPENCYIVSPKLSGFDPSNQRLMVYSYEYREPSNGNNYWEITEYYTSRSSGYPYSDSNNYTTNINLTYYIQENPDNKYFDITKGYSIKNDNTTNVIWDNEYNNGNIQLLFRAENTPGTYHNDIIVGNNTISIDYIVNRYYVTLNGGDPVDIGTWRNIILDINMINGELSVIPVRTFNSFTNVETDNTNIFIGDLINPTPTNIIEWAPTTNSLMFNVYSTSVFMNTYGVVMVNPTLNITDYFTNLDNFYQLKISNISVVGQSMTINGITGTVTGNTVTFNDETIQIKDMTITYADGHAYISDSHATIDLGEITDNIISMSGAWYFITDLMRGYTTQKMIYEWDWQDFILDNVQFCIIYIGLALIGLLIARRYCTLTITDYAVFLVSIVIALTVQVIA